MTQDTYSIYQQIIHSMNIGFHFFGSDYSAISAVDHHLREQLYPDHAYERFIEIFHRQASSRSILKIRDTFSVYYYFYNAPRFSPDGCMYYCLGPVLREEMTDPMLDDILKKHGLPEILRTELYGYYNRIPVMENLAVFERMLLSITSGIFEQKLSMATLSEAALQPPANSRHDFSATNRLSNTIENTYRLENQIMDAVAAGDAVSAKKYFNMQNQMTFRPRPGNPLRNMKNRLIVFNVLLRKAIEKGGVHPIYIDDISTRFAIEIEKNVSLLELEPFLDQMINDYCSLVQTHAMGRYHPLIRQCILHIEQHYSEELSLKQLADAHYVSRQYLSSLFKQETGMNLTNYIQKCQIGHALKLLENPELSIARVAAMCGHKNTAYFTKLFKDSQQMTPREYRKKLFGNEKI